MDKVSEKDHEFAYQITWTGSNDSNIANEALNGARVEVEFSATLNSDAVLGKEGNVNACKLAFSNNPLSKDDSDEEELPWDYVIAFTYKVDVSKVDTESKPLAGAEFKLEKLIKGTTDAQDTYVEVKGIANGGGDKKNLFTATGLDDGTYRLVEVVAPDGYSKIDPIEFTITATHNEVWDYPPDATADPVFDNDGKAGSNRLALLTTLEGSEKIKATGATGTGLLKLEASEQLAGLVGNVVNNKDEQGGNIVVRKTVVSTRSEDKTRNYKFTVTLYKDKEYKQVDKSVNAKYGDMKFKDGVATFTLKHGQTKKVENIPVDTEAGLYYKVEEIDSGDLTPLVGNPTKSKDDLTHTIQCTNTYHGSSAATKSGSGTASRLGTARTGDPTSYLPAVAVATVAVTAMGLGIYRRRSGNR